MSVEKPDTPLSCKMPPKETPPRKFLNPDDVDVSALNCNEFAEWLNAKQFSPENCEAFRGTYIRTCNHYLLVRKATYISTDS